MADYTVILVRENYAELRINNQRDIQEAIRLAIKEVEESDIYERGYWKLARVHKISEEHKELNERKK